jgi:small-conductance mechanosensitive channel
MMFVQNWGEVFTNSLQGIWYGVASFVPTLVIAVVIFAIGWVLATLIEKIVESIFKSLKIDNLLRSAGVDDVMKRTGHPLNSGAFVGALVKWFVIVVFLIASFDVLGLNQVNAFLKDVVLSYLPQVIIAVLILMVAVVVGEAMQKVVTASARAAHVKSAHLLGVLTRWAIWIFALLTALFQLGIAPALIQTVVMGIIAGAALAFGLAFGLGGKDYASGIIEKTAHKLTDKE